MIISVPYGKTAMTADVPDENLLGVYAPSVPEPAPDPVQNIEVKPGFPWAVRGYSQGNLTSLSLGTAKLAPGGAPGPGCLVTRCHSSAQPCTCVLDP